MTANPKVTWIGFRTLIEAQQCIKVLTSDYVIAAVTEGRFDGDVLAYVVIHKNADPVGGSR
jgi:hypothetical protein